MVRACILSLLLLGLAPRAARADDVAQQLQDRFITVAEAISDSVVYLEVKSIVGQGVHAATPFMDSGPGGYQPLVLGAGSGVVLDHEGHILTNYHVIEGAIEITVRTHDNRTFAAEVVGEDPDSDLAVVRIAAEALQPATFADPEDLHIGQWAIAIGAPFGLRYSITVGHVSARSRRAVGDLPIQDFIQTDASINPGNSGGPLVDIEGRVIGINTMIIGLGTGIGLAIPTDIARAVATSLIQDGEVLRGDPGMTFQDGEPPLPQRLGAPVGIHGVVVSTIVPGGPAESAGLERGDVITTLDGVPATDAHELLDRFLATAPERAVDLDWFHGGKRQRGQLVVGLRHAREAVAAEEVEHTGDDIGVNVDVIPPDVNQRMGRPADAPGLLVTQIRPGSPAHRADIAFGDVILEVEGTEVRYPIDVARGVLGAHGDHVLLYTYRFADLTYRYIALEKP
jgi:serine protease Do